jgi:hypothetical protein
MYYLVQVKSVSNLLSEIPQQFADELFNLMCIDGYIKNELLFESFLHENRYVRNNVKKINKKKK